MRNDIMRNDIMRNDIMRNDIMPLCEHKVPTNVIQPSLYSCYLCDEYRITLLKDEEKYFVLFNCIERKNLGFIYILLSSGKYNVTDDVSGTELTFKNNLVNYCMLSDYPEAYKMLASFGYKDSDENAFDVSNFKNAYYFS